MTEKELLKQLKNLKQTRPSTDWQSSNRQVLLQQVFNGQADQGLPWTAKLNLIMSRVVQPTVIALMIFVFLLGGSLVGWSSGNAKPGDSLYIAKRLSERTKLTVALTDQAKTRLNLEFANERAKELVKLIDQAEQTEAVAELRLEFKSQINQAKERLAKNQVVVDVEPDLESETESVVESTSEGNEEEVGFSLASDNKDEVGLDIAVPEEAEVTAETEEKATNNETEVVKTEAEIKAGKKADVAKAAEEIEQLLEQEDLSGAAAKLQEIEEIIDQE